MREYHDLEDCASASGTSHHDPESSVPEAMDVDEVEDTATDDAQAPDEDVNIERPE